MAQTMIGLDIAVLGKHAPHHAERPKMTLAEIGAAVEALPFEEAKRCYAETVRNLSSDVTRDIINYVDGHGHPSSGVSSGDGSIAFKGKITFDGAYTRGNWPRGQEVLINYRPDGTLIPYKERPSGN